MVLHYCSNFSAVVTCAMWVAHVYWTLVLSFQRISSFIATGEAEAVSVVLEATVSGPRGDIGVVVGVVETAGID